MGRLCRADSEAAKRFGLKVGDRVISLVKWGGNSRYLSVDLSQVVKVPESVDPAAAVCLAETYLAAFQILHRGHNNRVRYRESALKGKTIMILGYGISSMTRAIAQLASHAGALKIFAMAKLKHFEQLSDLGISSVNKDSLEWWDALSGKVDIMVSNEEVVALHHKLLKGNGQIVVVKHGKNDGSSDTYDQKTGIIGRRKKWLHQNRTWSYDVYDEWDHNVERCMLDLHHLLQLLEHKRIEPHVLDRISLGKVARAQQLLESKCLTGFVVCEPWLVAKSRAVRL